LTLGGIHLRRRGLGRHAKTPQEKTELIRGTRAWECSGEYKKEKKKGAGTERRIISTDLGRKLPEKLESEKTQKPTSCCTVEKEAL